MIALAEAQARFHRLATRPAPDPAEARALLVSTPALGAEERLAVYAGMYRARLVEALRAAYPCLARLLSPERFRALGACYAGAFPSSHPDLGRFGRALPEFLASHPGDERPDLADLAALERARWDAFTARDAAPVGASALCALGPRRAAAATLAILPGTRVLALGYAVAPVWRALDDGVEPPPPAAGPSHLVVWRRGFDVCHASAAPDEAAALERAHAGRPLAEVCAAFEARADAAAAAYQALSGWFEQGLVAAVRGG